MKKRLLWRAFLIPALLLIAGCDTSLTVGAKTIGIQSGAFTYTEGYLRATYNFPFDKVWPACEKTLTGMKATDVEPVSYTHLRAHETRHDLVCRLLLEKKKI